MAPVVRVHQEAACKRRHTSLIRDATFSPRRVGRLSSWRGSPSGPVYLGGCTHIRTDTHPPCSMLTCLSWYACCSTFPRLEASRLPVDPVYDPKRDRMGSKVCAMEWVFLSSLTLDFVFVPGHGRGWGRPRMAAILPVVQTEYHQFCGPGNVFRVAQNLAVPVTRKLVV